MVEAGSCLAGRLAEVESSRSDKGRFYTSIPESMSRRSLAGGFTLENAEAVIVEQVWSILPHSPGESLVRLLSDADRLAMLVYGHDADSGNFTGGNS